MELNGKTVLITGATGALGGPVTRAFEAGGFKAEIDFKGSGTGLTCSYRAPFVREEGKSVRMTKGVVGGPVTILSATQTYSPGAVTSIRLSGAVLTLMASATGAQYASITGQPQNEFSITFTAAPVPEPESYAMLGAGLFLIGAIVRRRRS